MNIAIDANEANEKLRVGVNQYAFEIITSIYRIIEKDPKDYKVTLYLRDKPRNDLPKETQWWSYQVLAGKRLWVIRRLMIHLLLHKKHNVLFVPNHYAPPLSRIPVVSTIHDLGYLEFTGQFNKYDFWQLKVWTAITLIISKYIISVSNATKADILQHYKFMSQDKIKTVYHGFDTQRFCTENGKQLVDIVRNKYKIPKNYILSIGTLKPSKNIVGIIESFAKSNLTGDWNLVIAGKKGWLYESIFETVKKHKLIKRVVFTGYIDEEDKPGLYTGAKVLLSPSFWEGFGMQVLESNACGTPAIVSNVASLPEVAGESGLFVDPNNIKQISERLEYVVHMDNKEYKELSQKCVQNSQRFSWEKSAKTTLEILYSAGRAS